MGVRAVGVARLSPGGALVFSLIPEPRGARWAPFGSPSAACARIVTGF